MRQLTDRYKKNLGGNFGNFIMNTMLIEKLIVNPSEETTELLYDNHSEVFWVDWREEDSTIIEYCENIIKTRSLDYSWMGKKLNIQYKDLSREVPLTYSDKDRHITLMAINNILKSDYEVRMVWDSDGSDTVAFTILSISTWNTLEEKFGAEAVSKAFLKLTSDLNVFTDSLAKHRPGLLPSKPWWKFW